ncbi:hypothetical protein AAFF_G00299550 [Aldrovandia affinis]|uniref:Uncharacterized protein n=1 Tax=Aldrovandia affinis TaxID=143900 RepID=A0AAD7R8T9_9TELE|nr:hypothetical protein AAFF_G00299550 [Aldrovandia affinis]
MSGGRIDVVKHLGNLKYRVWEEMLKIVQYTPVTLNPNTTKGNAIISEDLTSVLAPLAKALDLFQSDKLAYYGVLLPTITTLIEKLQKIKGIQTPSRMCLMATACHPMFRMEDILTEQKADTKTGLREEVRRLQTPSTSPTADEEEDPVSEDDITSFFPKKKDDRLDEAEVFLKSLDTSLLTAFSSLQK